MSNRRFQFANLLQTTIPAVRQSPLRLFLVVAVALCGLMTLTDLPSAAPVHAQEQEVTATRDATGEDWPERPTNLQASSSHDSVTLTWTASTDDTVTHYAVLRRDRNADDAGVFKVIDSNAGPETSYTDDSVSPKGSYVYRVKAVNTTGVSQWSSYARADTPADPADLAPGGLSAKAVSGDDGVIEGVALAWDAPAEDAASVTGYEVLRAVGDGGLATLVADTGSAGTTYTDDTATEAGESYAYRVKALRGEEASQPSDRALAIIPKATPVEPEPPITERQSAHVEVWSATLFSQNIDIEGSLGCSNDIGLGKCSGSSYLTDDDFDYDGASYTVTAITLATDGTLDIDVSATPTDATIADLVLNVDTSNIFRLSDATVTVSTLSWASTGLDWAEARGVFLSLNAGNRPPVSPSSVSHEVPENSPAGTDVGAPVTAVDPDGDTLTYTLEGTDAASFDIVSSTGQIQTISGVTYDFETKQSYFVTVKADDGNGGTDTTFVGISVADVDEPPSALGAPAVSPVTGSSDSLEVTWTAPDNTGKPVIQSYDLQYRRGTSGSWTDGPQDETGLSATLTGLDAGSEYQVQVRATNNEGDGDWSASGTGTTNAQANVAVWSATLTIKLLDSSGALGCSSANSDTDLKCTTNLTDTTFSYDNTNYTVDYLYLNTGQLWFGVRTNTTDMTVADLVLNIGGTAFALSDALVSGPDIAWSNSGLNWTADSDVSVTLTRSASADATLSALSLSGVALSPSFAADTLAYTGSVDNAVTAVTATANHDGAAVAIVPPDADDTADGHQVALDVGDTAISVTVTAEDGTTMQTYTVTVTRAEAVEQDTALWSATLTVADLGSGTYGCSNEVSGKECSSLLDDDDFTYNGTMYQIKLLLTLTGTSQLLIHFTEDLGEDADSFVLNAGDDVFAFQDGSDDFAFARGWASPGSWSDGESVSLSITMDPTVWSATLSVKDAEGGDLGCHNSVATALCSASLTEVTFDYDNTNYTVFHLFLRPSGTLEFNVTTNTTDNTAADLVLNIGGTAFALSGRVCVRVLI